MKLTTSLLGAPLAAATFVSSAFAQVTVAGQFVVGGLHWIPQRFRASAAKTRGSLDNDLTHSPGSFREART